MSETQIAPTGANSNHLARRGLFAGALLAAGVAAAPASARDGAIIALCREYAGKATQHAALMIQQEALPDDADAEWDRLDDLAVEIGGRMADLEDLIADTAAITAAGQRAKAEVLLVAAHHTADTYGGHLSRSLARDILAGRA